MVVMGIKQIPLIKFVKWLESIGLEYQRTSASHDHYNYPERHPKRLTRCVTVRTKNKDVPLFHIHTNLQTLGISKKQFEEEIKAF
jgi:predicted RNA binding protein YcfA (HicA-like mRNA interferase family)